MGEACRLVCSSGPARAGLRTGETTWMSGMNGVSSMSSVSSPWTPDSWRRHPAQQMPEYADAAALAAAEAQLAKYPPLVFAGEARTLDESGAQDAMVPLLLSIGEKHGPDAINTIAHATDRSIEARKRCQAMYWFFDEINAQPEQQRADLIRTLWAMKGDK